MFSARQSAIARCEKSRHTPGALRHGVVRGRDRGGRPAQVLDVLVNPVADGDDLLVRVLDLAEQVPGQAAEPIGLAVAAGKQVGNARGAQLRNRRRPRPHRRGRSESRTRPTLSSRSGQLLVSPGLQSEEAVARTFSREFRDLDPRLHGELLVEDDLRGAPLGVNVQDQRRGKLRCVLQVAGDMKKHEGPPARLAPAAHTTPVGTPQRRQATGYLARGFHRTFVGERRGVSGEEYAHAFGDVASKRIRRGDRLVSEQHRAIQRVRHDHPVEVRRRHCRIVNCQQAASRQALEERRQSRQRALRAALVQHFGEVWKTADLPDHQPAKLHQSRCQHHGQLLVGVGAKVGREFRVVVRFRCLADDQVPRVAGHAGHDLDEQRLLAPEVLVHRLFRDAGPRRNRVHVGAEIPALQEHVRGGAENGGAFAGGTTELFNLVGSLWRRQSGFPFIGPGTRVDSIRTRRSSIAHRHGTGQSSSITPLLPASRGDPRCTGNVSEGARTT